MKKLTLLGLFGALLLAGCADLANREGAVAPGYDSARPKVFVVKNLAQALREGEGDTRASASGMKAAASDVAPILVDPPSLYFRVSDGGSEPIDIIWSLPKNDRYEFRAGSITFPGYDQGDNAEFRCHLGPTTDGLTYTCTNRRSAEAAYKYNIRVYDKSAAPGAPPAFTLDPGATNGH